MLDESEKIVVADIGIQVGGGVDRVHAGLIARLQDSEAMTKILRCENDKQKKELTTLKAATMNSNSGNRSRQSLGETSQDENHHKFPPLQSQSYWHRGSKGNNRCCFDKKC